MVVSSVGVLLGPRCQYNIRSPPQNSLFGVQVKCTLPPSNAMVSTGCVWNSVAWPNPQIDVITRMSWNIVAVDTCRMSDEITANCSLFSLNLFYSKILKFIHQLKTNTKSVVTSWVNYIFYNKTSILKIAFYKRFLSLQLPLPCLPQNLKLIFKADWLMENNDVMLYF